MAVVVVGWPGGHGQIDRGTKSTLWLDGQRSAMIQPPRSSNLRWPGHNLSFSRRLRCTNRMSANSIPSPYSSHSCPSTVQHARSPSVQILSSWSQTYPSTHSPAPCSLGGHPSKSKAAHVCERETPPRTALRKRRPHSSRHYYGGTIVAPILKSLY